MSDEQLADKDVENDPERTLITLDQLSQTIEVMTSVVNRLRRHLSEQLKAQIAEQAELEKLAASAASAEGIESTASATNPESTDSQIKVSGKVSESAQARERFVVEITQQETDPDRKSNKVLH